MYKEREEELEREKERWRKDRMRAVQMERTEPQRRPTVVVLEGVVSGKHVVTGAIGNWQVNIRPHLIRKTQHV